MVLHLMKSPVLIDFMPFYEAFYTRVVVNVFKVFKQVK